jgi:release factor glutamine methyltransferase
VDRLDAHLLLAHVMTHSRSWLLANDDASLTEEQRQLMGTFIEQRASGEPVAYLLGEKEFYGLPLSVSPAVLIPRPDTETLVDWALELMRGLPLPNSVLDMGTGSGAIALALKHNLPSAHVTALDASAGALAVAIDNAARLQLDVHFLPSDWWERVTGQRFNLIVSNPPYVAGDDEHLIALQHEPQMALTPGGDGLGALRHIVAGASAHLHDGGWLLLEHGHDQAPAVAGMLTQLGFGFVTTRHDLAGIPRCTGGRWG